MKKILLVSLLLGGCAAAPQVAQVPVPVQVPCPAPKVPPKVDLSALAALKPTDPPKTVIEVLVDSLKKLAADDQDLRALLGEHDAKQDKAASPNDGSSGAQSSVRKEDGHPSQGS